VTWETVKEKEVFQSGEMNQKSADITGTCRETAEEKPGKDQNLLIS
jgi:hypothetical protein